ncbi:MAG: adenylylsulfate kinase [Thiomicrorhabdus sp.]|nr:MAG: adenylylsulfate kinase [Thiomicrorhabdus sp.]
MYIETSRRSLVKGITWRFLATTTTIIIVYLFFGRLDLALAAGLLETTAKIFLYYLHERGWQKITFGKKRVEPFNLWIIGLPLSGKKVLADRVYESLEKQLHIPLERVDNREVREILPETGYDRDDRIMHLKRVGYLIKKLQRHSVSTICSFVSPYQESRDAVKNMTENYVEVYIDLTPEQCQNRENSEFIESLGIEQVEDLARIKDHYDKPSNPDIVIKADEALEQAVEHIVTYVKKNLVQ